MTNNSSCAEFDFQFSTLVDLLRFRALHQPDRIGFIFLSDGEKEEVRLNYRELDQQARAIASRLQELNLTGERVLLFYPSGLKYIAAFYGCLYAGVIPIPAYPPQIRPHHRSALRFVDIMENVQANWIMAKEDFINKFQAVYGSKPPFEKLRWLATDDIDLADADDWIEPEINGDSLAYLQYTSGSTSKPKGVMVAHRNVLYNAELIYQSFGVTSESCGVIWLPPYHDMGLIGGVIEPLYAGIPVVLLSPLAFLQRPLRWLRAISHYKATFSGGPNFAYDLCVQKITAEQRATLDLSSWQLAFNGSEPIQAKSLERFVDAFASCGFRLEAFYPCYGLAESTLLVTGRQRGKGFITQSFYRKQLEQNWVVPVESYEDRKNGKVISLVGCGWSWGNQKIVIVDPELRKRCAADEVGEIWVTSESVAKGYWKRPSETANTFQAFLADTCEGPFLRTGDLGFFKNGELFITGRIKELIIIKGRNHHPQDIERTVEGSHPALRPRFGAAFGVEVDGEEQLVVVQAVESKQLLNVDVDEVMGNICEAVTAQHGLQVYDTVLVKAKSIPRTPSGKIQRNVCRTAFLDGTLDELGRG